MSRHKRSGARASGHPGRRAQAHHDETQEMLNRMFRPACSVCGAPVMWMTGAEAVDRGLDLTEWINATGAGLPKGRDVWACTSCDQFGMMGPAEFD